MSNHPITEIMSNQIEIEEGEVSIESNTSSQENIKVSLNHKKILSLNQKY